MALLFETPYPAEKHGRRFHVARLIATGGAAPAHPAPAALSQELVKFCRHYGIPAWAIQDGVVHISGRQIEAARMAGAKEVSPAFMDTLIRSKTNG